MSDLISIECPNCSAKLKVRDSGDPDKKVRCPKCEESFAVGEQEEEPPVAARKRRAPVDEDDSPAPRKRRKSGRDDGEDDRRGKKKKKAGLNQLVLLGIASGVALLVLVGIVLLVVFMPRGKKLTAPESYSTYQAPEGEFSCLVPADWRLEEGGIKNTRSITVKKGKASIHVRQSLAGSLVGDIAGAANMGADVPDDRLPVSRVHELKKDAIAEEVGGKYEEEPATTVMTKGFGKARRSAFTSTGALSKTRGYRATVLANMISYDVICQGSPDDWVVLEPAFAKAIESLGMGTGR